MRQMPRRESGLYKAVAACFAFTIILWTPLTADTEITEVSVSNNGESANGLNDWPSISADGQVVAFASEATNLVENDNNNRSDIFVRNLKERTTIRVSVSSDGVEANSASRNPAISADGRFVAFQSGASNLVPDDDNNMDDIFLHEIATGQTTRVVDGKALGYGGMYYPSLSADGRLVAFEGSKLGQYDDIALFVHDRDSSETKLLGRAIGMLECPRVAISASGRFAAFSSNSSPPYRVFLFDLEQDTSSLVSVNRAGALANDDSFCQVINADGSVVAFASLATDLVEGDNNEGFDIFVRDLASSTTERASVSSGGEESTWSSSFHPSLSGSGKHVSFTSSFDFAPDGTNWGRSFFLRDLENSETVRIGPQGYYSDRSSLSADGRYVAFMDKGGRVLVLDRFPSKEPAVVGEVLAVPNPVAVQASVDLTATATGSSNILSAAWSLDGMVGAMEPADGNFNSPTEWLSASLMAPYEAGVYDVCVNAVDVANNASEDACISLVAYDPSAGFVTGGGWIWSPPGALFDDTAAMGRANFGFVSRYRKGANVPDGSTQFVFQAGGLNFHSNAYDWLVVTGSNYAMFKGSGTVNGANAETGHPYQFMIWAGDGNVDTFRIKIWYEDDGEVLVYDNGMDQSIGGGQIIVHTGGKAK